MLDSSLKINGKKGKLIPFITQNLPQTYGTVYDVFAGSGIVGLNLVRTKVVFSDINPHIINFYQFLKGPDAPEVIKGYLEAESPKLTQEYYLEVRKRFNESHNPLDFLFLTRTCFNGLMRFNSKGGFNTPYCKKDSRFSKSYITKIYNILKSVHQIVQESDFLLQDFAETIKLAGPDDLLYLDPPYFGLHATYFDTWTEETEKRLFEALNKTPAKFMMSTWVENGVRRNPMIDKYWGRFKIVTQSHTYHIGANVENRRKVTEGLILNF